jgi:hypothetical protein
MKEMLYCIKWDYILETLKVMSDSFAGIISICAVVVTIFTYCRQRDLNKLQMFESTIFNMINLHISITNNLSYRGKQPTSSPVEGAYQFQEKVVSGMDVFKFFWERCWFLKKYMNDEKTGINKLNLDWKNSREGMQQVLISYGSEIYGDYKYELNCLKPYFCHLYEMIRFIDTNGFTNKSQKQEYVNQIRSILSPYELVWIYYDCLFGESTNNLKPLVEKYALLKYLSRESLTITRDIMNSQIFESGNINDFEYYRTKDKSCKSKFYEGAFMENYNDSQHLICGLIQTRLIYWL